MSDLGPNQKCPPPHSWSSPSPSAQEQGADALPYHILFSPPPREQRTRVVIKPAPPPAAKSQDISRQTQTPPPKLLFQQKGEGQEKGSEQGAQEATGIWTGLATGRERGTNKPTLGRISLPNTRIKGLEALSTCPSCLP